jgi:hypothetical protein
LAKINYGFEKRQRELAKKRKQEAKDARKREARESAVTPDTTPDQALPEPPPAETPATVEDGTPAPRVHRRPSS